MSHVRKIVRTDVDGKEYTRYQARWTDATTGRPRAKRFTSKKAAQAWLTRVEVAAASGETLAPAPAGQTVAAYLNEWVDQTVTARLASGSYSPTTAASHESYVRVHLIPHLGDRMLEQLSVDDVERMLDRMIATGSKPATARKARSTLSRALTDAVRRRRLPVNVAKQAEPPALEPGDPSAFTAAELAAIVEAWDGHRLEALFEFILYTGLRLSEVVGLRWSNVDLDAGTYTVKRGLHVVSKRSAERLGIVDHRHAESRAKTRASRATTDMSRAAVQLLTDHRHDQRKARLAARRWDDPDLVFATSVGTPLNAPNVRRDWEGILTVAGVRTHHDGRLRGPQELRRTFATRLRAAGIPIEDVQRLGRWASPTVMLGSYSASSSERLRAAAEAAAEGV